MWGDEGEVIKVLRDETIVETFGTVAYHVRFPGRTLQVPEMALADASDPSAAVEGCR